MPNLIMHTTRNPEDVTDLSPSCDQKPTEPKYRPVTGAARSLVTVVTMSTTLKGEPETGGPTAEVLIDLSQTNRSNRGCHLENHSRTPDP